MALSGALVSVLVAGDAAAGVELASTFVLRGRRGTWRQALAFCVGRRHLAQPLCHTTFRHSSSSSFSRRPPVTHTTQLCHTPSFTHNFVNHHLSHTLFHTHFHTQLFHHTHTHHLSLSHTNFHMQLCHHNLHHLLCLSFPVPATTFGAHDWTKLTCGVIRSFNCFSLLARSN